MKMKKKVSALICGVLMAITSVSFATVRADQVMLGDLQPGMKLSQVKEVYGEPLEVSGDKMIYKGFYIEVKEKNKHRVEEIVTEDSGFATSEGIIVGMSEEVLNKAYGTADKIDGNSYDKEYEYYSSNHKYKMEFKVHNGIITKITCELND